MGLVEGRVEFLAHLIRVKVDFTDGQIQMQEGLAGHLQAGLEFGLHHLIDAVLVQGLHLIDARGPGHNVQGRIQVTHPVHHQLRGEDRWHSHQHQPGLVYLGGFQHYRLGGVAKDDRIARRLGLLHPAKVQLHNHKSQPHAL